MANQQDANFVQELSSGNTAEITEGSLAIKQSPELAVSEFGRWMVADHTALGSLFAKVAEKAGFSVSTEPNSTDQAKIDELAKLSGKNFDQAYVKEQVTDHKQVLALLQQEVSNGQDQGLVNFAKQSLPLIKAHLQEAQILASDLIPGFNSSATNSGGTSNSSGGSSDSQSASASYAMGGMQHQTCSQGMMAMSQDHKASWTS
jgi:putative membrane protein